MIEIVTTAITVFGVIVTAFFAYMGNKRAKSVDDAVNHRHSGEPRLFDVVKMTRADQLGMRRDVERVENNINRLDGKIDGVNKSLSDHVVWEAEQKYKTEAEILSLIAAAKLNKEQP